MTLASCAPSPDDASAFIWISQDREKTRLGDMDSRHIANLHRYLLRELTVLLLRKDLSDMKLYPGGAHPEAPHLEQRLVHLRLALRHLRVEIETRGGTLPLPM